MKRILLTFALACILLPAQAQKKTYDFTAKFDEVSEKLIYYYEKYADRVEISWMMELLMSYKRIMDNPKLSEIYKKGED